MKVLLDTNIVIHREAPIVIKDDIGVLFGWLDRLHYTKCVHPITVEELLKNTNSTITEALQAKLENYTVLKTMAPMAAEVKDISGILDKDKNGLNDTQIINELYCDRVDILITEDKGLHNKALRLGITERVFTIDAFLEKVTAENPGFVDYNILAIRKELFGNIDVADGFFDSFRNDYPDFDKWFNKKAEETVYVCKLGGELLAFLYLKPEGEDEDYSNILPSFARKKRLKIGTLKVALNGLKLGERFLRIVFENALRLKVSEIYVTTFERTAGQELLVKLLGDYGFVPHGIKGDAESVYVRDFRPSANRACPKLSYPFFSTQSNVFIVPIYPEYHTELLPDSILRTESPSNFVENKPHRNAISKVYIARSFERDLQSGDIIIFYRTGGFYKGVVTTVGIVESMIDGIPNETEFIRLCRKRSVFSDAELSKYWNYSPSNKPFIVNFLYAHSFPKKINLKRLIELGVIQDVESVPRGFERIAVHDLRNILKECEADENLIVN